MPLDLSAIQDQNEKKLRDLLAAQGSSVQSNLDRYKNTIEGGRNAYFSENFDPLVGAFGGAATEAKNFQTDKLASILAPKLSGIGLSQKNRVLGLQGDNLTRNLQDARNAYLATQTYGRNQAFTRSAQDFESSQSALGRDLKEQEDRIASDFEKRGLDLEEAYSPQSDYEAAIARALGVLTGVGGIYAYNKFGRGNNTPLDPGTNIVGSGNTLTEQSGFVPRTLRSYGR